MSGKAGLWVGVALAIAIIGVPRARASTCATLRVKAAHVFAACGWAAEKKAAKRGDAVVDLAKCDIRLAKVFARVEKACGGSVAAPDEADIGSAVSRVGSMLGTAIREGSAPDGSALCGSGLLWDDSTRTCIEDSGGDGGASVVAPTADCATAWAKAAGAFSACVFGAEKKAARKSEPPDTSACPARLQKLLLRATASCGGPHPTIGEADIGQSIARLARAVGRAARDGTALDLVDFCGAGTQWSAQTGRCEAEGAPASLPTGLSTFFFEQEVEGLSEQRRYLVAAPNVFVPGQAYPVLFAFHGNGGTGDGFVPAFSSRVEAGEFIGVYPDGMQNSWNLGREASQADDVAFVDGIVAHLAGYAEIDIGRMFAYGSSNGAGLVHKLGIETDHFDGIAAVVTSLLVNDQPAPGSRSVGVLQVLGTEDGLIPYEGGVGVLGHEFMAAEDSALAWAAANACALPGTTTTTAEGNIRITYAGCTDGVEVLHFGIVGAGHGIPSGTEGGLIGLVVDFLQAQPDGTP